MGEVKVDTADVGNTALQLLASTVYDVVVTDIKMPGLDGLSLLREIQTRWPDTPTIMITGHGEHEFAVHALRGGAFDFIQKPLDLDYFVSSLRRAIHTSDSRRRVKDGQATLARRASELELGLENRMRELAEATSLAKTPMKWLIGSGRQMQNIIR